MGNARILRVLVLALMFLVSTGTYATVCYGLPMLGMAGMKAAIDEKLALIAAHDLAWEQLSSVRCSRVPVEAIPQLPDVANPPVETARYLAARSPAHKRPQGKVLGSLLIEGKGTAHVVREAQDAMAV